MTRLAAARVVVTDDDGYAYMVAIEHGGTMHLKRLDDPEFPDWLKMAGYKQGAARLSVIERPRRPALARGPAGCLF
jgi:hypothetical protein